MPAQLQITLRDVAHSDSLESGIRRRIAGLERICPRITSFRVTIGTDRHPVHGDRFSLKLDVRLPGLEVVVTRDHQDLHAALREACQAARRQLLDRMEQGRGADRARAAVPVTSSDEAAAND